MQKLFFSVSDVSTDMQQPSSKIKTAAWIWYEVFPCITNAHWFLLLVTYSGPRPDTSGDHICIMPSTELKAHCPHLMMWFTFVNMCLHPFFNAYCVPYISNVLFVNIFCVKSNSVSLFVSSVCKILYLTKFYLYTCWYTNCADSGWLVLPHLWQPLSADSSTHCSFIHVSYTELLIESVKTLGQWPSTCVLCTKAVVTFRPSGLSFRNC